MPSFPHLRIRGRQVLLPLPQRHHLQPELLHLRLVVQRGLRRVRRHCIAEAKNNELAETRESATAVAAEGSDAVGEYAAPGAEVGDLAPAAADSLAGYGQELGGYNRRRL